jgi:hypothetical protein
MDDNTLNQGAGPDGATPGQAVEPPSGPPISIPSAIAGIFASPGETFRRLKERPVMLVIVPILIVMAISAAGSFLFLNKVDMKELVRNQLRQSRFAAQMSQQQMDEVIEKAASRPRWINGVIGTVATPVTMVVLAGIFWLLLLAFGTEITFKGSFRAVGWSFLPMAVAGLLFMVVTSVKDASALVDPQTLLLTNPAAFFEQGTLAKPLMVFLGALDVFKIWVVVLLGIGLSVEARMKASKAILAVGGMYLLWTLIRVGLAAIF